MEPMIAWGAINDKDKELAQLRAALEQAKAAKEAQRAEFDAHQTAVQKATEDTEAIEREVEALDAKVEEASNEGKKAMAVARELKQKLKDSQAGEIVALTLHSSRLPAAALGGRRTPYHTPK